MVPKFWFLSRKADCRISQDFSSKSLLDKVLKLHGVDFLDDRTGSFDPKFDYCVQY